MLEKQQAVKPQTCTDHLPAVIAFLVHALLFRCSFSTLLSFRACSAAEQGSRPPTWRSRRGPGGLASTGRPAQGRGRKLPRRKPHRAPPHRGHVGGAAFLVLLAGLGRPDARILPGATGKQHGPRPLQAGPHGSILVHPRPPSHPPRPKAPPAAFSSRHPPASRAGLSPVPSVSHGAGRRSRSPPRPAGAVSPCATACPCNGV